MQEYLVLKLHHMQKIYATVNPEQKYYSPKWDILMYIMYPGNLKGFKPCIHVYVMHLTEPDNLGASDPSYAQHKS